MSERDLTDLMVAEVQAPVLRPILLYEGEFADPDTEVATYLRLWTGYGNLSWDSKTWTGAGHLLSLSPFSENTELRAEGFSVGLSGQTAEMVSRALQEVRQGKPGKIWLGMLTPVVYLELPGVSGNYAYTLDSASNSVTSDIDIRAKIAADDWTPAATMDIVDKRNVSNISYVLRLVATSGRLNFAWSVDGTTEPSISSTVSPTVSDGDVLWVRVTADFDATPSYTIKFWTSPDGVVWTQLGSTVTGAGSGTIFDGTSRLSVGASYAGASSQFAGKIYYAEVRNGIDGAIVATFDPKRYTAGALTAVMTTGETWTVNQSGGTPARIVFAGDEVLADPYLVQEGKFDIATLDDPGNAPCNIEAVYEGELIDLDRARERRWTKEDQALDYPTDRGFDQGPQLQDVVFTWGR